MEEAGCRFDEKTEKRVDSNINSAGALCTVMTLLWDMHLIWSDRKGSLLHLLCHKNAENILLS